MFFHGQLPFFEESRYLNIFLQQKSSSSLFSRGSISRLLYDLGGNAFADCL